MCFTAQAAFYCAARINVHQQCAIRYAYRRLVCVVNDRGPRFDSRSRREKIRCPNTLSLVSFAGMTLDKCIVLRIGTLTGCPLCRESHPLCRLKNPTVISIWLLVGFHPATRSVQSTPADNTRKRVWQYIEKEKEKKDKYLFF